MSAALKRRRLALPQAAEVLANFGKVRLQLLPVDLVAELELAAAFRIYACDAFALELAPRSAVRTPDTRPWRATSCTRFPNSGHRGVM